MAFFDWDGNGKIDFADDYIEYNIYKACTEENEYTFDSADDFFDDVDEE